MSDSFIPLAGHTSLTASESCQVEGMYSELCELGVLERAYAEVVQHLGRPGFETSDAGDVGPQRVEGLIATLAKDLQARMYEPGAGGSDGVLRDMVIQSGFGVLLEPLFAQACGGGQEPEKASQWVARNIERDLMRVYAVELEPGSGAACDERVLRLQERVSDPEFVGLLERLLRCAPERPQRSLLSPVLENIALQRVDGVLQEATMLGRRDGVLHVNCGRFGNELIVLVDADSHFDWVLPAVQGRLRAACEQANVAIDETTTQVVDLDRGDKLRFLDFEFHCVPGPATGRCVRYKPLGKVQQPEPEPAVESAKRLARRPIGALTRHLLSPFQRVAAAFGSLIPKLSQQEAGPVTRFLSSDWRVMIATLWHGLLSFARWARKHWELTAGSACALCILVIALQAFSELPWESALADDSLGFRTGGYYSSFASKPVEYALYIPPRPAYEEALPLILFLDDSAHPDRILEDGLAAAIRERLKSGGDFRFAVFFPGHPRDRWVTDKTAGAIMETLDDIMKRHAIDPKRVYLVGQASDGWAVWDLAERYPDRWAAIVAVNPRYTLYSIAQARIPCWIFECTSEARLFPINVQGLTRAFEATGTEVQYTAYQKSGPGLAREVYANPKLWTWLAQKSR